MVQPSEIREHMEVMGSDGGHVGRVDHVLGEEIELAKWDTASGLRHHLIPLTWVDHVDSYGVHLNRTRDFARQEWRVKE